MHLHTLHRSAYYFASASIAPRSTSSGVSHVWSIIGPIIIALVTLVLVLLLILWLKHRLSTRRLSLSAQGELAHFRSGSLRRMNKNHEAAPGVQKRPGQSAFVGRSPLPDADQFGMYDFGLITKPRMSYNRPWRRPGHDEEAQAGPDIGKTTPACIQK
ncbi:hypothetical protein SMMN14_02603 [Sphaerulina musiva]